MIFAEDMLELVVAGLKTQTRRKGRARDGACSYAPGRTYAVQAARGGSEVARIAVTSTAWVPVYGISRADALEEGFASPEEFHDRWMSMHGNLRGWCWRITFELWTQAAAGRPRSVVPPRGYAAGASFEPRLEVGEGRPSVGTAASTRLSARPT